MVKYDQLYQDWLRARRTKDYKEADRIREEFERLHGLTIYAEGEMVVEGEEPGCTVRRMLARDWEKKYGNPKVGQSIADQDSYVASKYPGYKGLEDKGYHC